MSIVSAPINGNAVLTTEAAVAARVLRSGTVPSEFFDWLGDPKNGRDCPREYGDVHIQAAIDEILLPLRDSVCLQDKDLTIACSNWLTAIYRYTADSGRSLGLGITSRMLAASLLPLYRCLATGDLTQSLAQSRCRTAEVLTLVALCHELGADFITLLNSCNDANTSPASVLKERFQVDLVRAAAIVCQHAGQDDGSQAIVSDVANLEGGDGAPIGKIVEWAKPELLWQLSSELLAPKSELHLPRTWIDTPVPWASVTEHWNALAVQLSAAPVANRGRTSDVSSAESTDNACRAEEFEAVPDGNAAEEASRRASVTPAAGGRESTALASNANVAPDSTASDVNGTESQAVPVAEQQPLETQQSGPNSAGSRVLIAEIHTYSDPVFVNVIRRQIATCRAEGRAISLATIVVLPERDTDDDEIYQNCGNGLSFWQQKLVNWMAEQPHVSEPYAFLTTDGELILCLLDLERNETTNLLRHGLVEILTGKRVDDSLNSLAKVNVPARYHAGIASTPSPGASFTANELIEAAARCLSAASRHGKASIKSIEVF